MRFEKIMVNNIKCLGCSNTIQNTLMSTNGVNSCDIDLDNKLVTVECENNIKREYISGILLKLGYPEIALDTINKLNSTEKQTLNKI